MAQTLCERWKALLQELAMDTQKAEMSRVGSAERNALRQHVPQCADCQDMNDRVAYLEFEGDCEGALDKLEDFLFGGPPDKSTMN